MDKWPIKNPLHKLYIDTLFSESKDWVARINDEKDKIRKTVEWFTALSNIELSDDGSEKIYKDDDGSEYTKSNHTDEELENKYNTPRSINQVIKKARELKDLNDILDYFKYIRIYKQSGDVDKIFNLLNIAYNTIDVSPEDKKAILNIFESIRKVNEAIINNPKSIWYKNTRYAEQYALIDSTYILMEEELEITEDWIIIRKIINITEEMFSEIKEKWWLSVKEILEDNIENISELWLNKEKNFYVKYEDKMILIKVWEK